MSSSIAIAKLAALLALTTNCCLYCCGVRVVTYWAPDLGALAAASSSARRRSVARTADCKSVIAICCEAGTCEPAMCPVAPAYWGPDKPPCPPDLFRFEYIAFLITLERREREHTCSL